MAPQRWGMRSICGSFPTKVTAVTILHLPCTSSVDRSMAQRAPHKRSDSRKLPDRISLRCEYGDPHSFGLGLLGVAEHPLGEASVTLCGFRDVEMSEVYPQSVRGLHDLIAVFSPRARKVAPLHDGAIANVTPHFFLEVAIIGDEPQPHRARIHLKIPSGDNRCCLSTSFRGLMT